MSASKPPATGYLLTKLGQLTTARFAERIAGLGIRPKHYGLLVTVEAMPGSSQSELGRALGLVPSAIVTMLDDLETLGAVARHPDPASRRRFVIELTAKGRELVQAAGRLGEDVDREILGGLDRSELAGLHETLLTLAARHALVPDAAASARP